MRQPLRLAFSFSEDAMTEVSFEASGATLYAVDTGTGRPIILMHGGLANHLAVRRFAEPLSKFRLITPDVRAAGRSHFGGALTWDLLADDVAALVRHLGLGRAVIGGVSSGAGVAVRTALRHPDIVDALVVLTPVFAGADVGLAPAAAEAMKRMDEAGQRTLREGIEVLLPLFPPELRERARALVATYDAASVAATTRFLASGAQPLATIGELAAITARTLVVPGVDPTHPREVAELYARHLPHATVVDTVDHGTAIADFLA